MTRALPVVLTVLALTAGSLTAQTVRIGVYGVGLSYGEIDEGGSAEGGGGGGWITLRIGRFGLEANGYGAKMEPDSAGTDFDILQGDIRLYYMVAPAVGIEIGAGHRSIDPDFAAQDVGVVRLGLYSEMELSRLADIWARGAYLVNSRFTGGGETGLAVEVAVGIGVGTANGRFRGRTDFEFQRIDRKVNNVDVPIQVAMARLGIEVGF